MDSNGRVRLWFVVRVAVGERQESNKGIWDLREKRHKGVEKGDKAFLESRTGYPAHGEVRVLKRRAGIAEETVRFKKERLDDAEQEYEDEHRTVTCFSKQLEEKWEQRFDALVRLALAAGVRNEDMAAVRQRPCRAVESVLESDGAVERAARGSKALQWRFSRLRLLQTQTRRELSWSLPKSKGM